MRSDIIDVTLAFLGVTNLVMIWGMPVILVSIFAFFMRKRIKHLDVFATEGIVVCYGVAIGLFVIFVPFMKLVSRWPIEYTYPITTALYHVLNLAVETLVLRRIAARNQQNGK